MQKSIADFAQAAQSVARMQAAQMQARAAARATPSAVPNGLAIGGLQVDPNVASQPSLWSGANLPTQTVAANHSTVTVQQTQPQAVLTWKTFNVGANTTLNFDQSAGGQAASSWVALNRVNDPSAQPSQILGAINAQGQVLVINQNGIIFGGGSQVNVNSLIASTADIPGGPNATFTGIDGTPAFTGATAGIVVEPGALITTNAPLSAVDRGGFILLMGKTVENAGSIATPNGQAILAAGQDFILRPGYSADANPTSTTLGTEVAVNQGGAVSNTGIIQAPTGDVTLAGQTVTQAGVLYATTSVNQRGTIHLLTDLSDPDSSVTLAPGSVTYIQPDTSGDTAIDAQRTTLLNQSTADDALRGTTSLLNDQTTLPDRLDQSRIEITTGGAASFQSGSLTMATGGQIAVSSPQRIFSESGAVLDAAGSLGAVLPASANTLSVSIQGFELRDAEANRDTNMLSSQTAEVDIRQLVLVPASTAYAQDRYYTAGGLLEVGGELGNVGHTIQEWTASGGSITLSANEVVAQSGSVFNIAGGTVRYQAGLMPTTWLKGSDGRLYNINTAPANITYTGLYGGFTTQHARWNVSDTFNEPLIAPSEIYQPGYTVGRDAGTLTLSTPSAVFEAEIDAGVVPGEHQNAARPASVTDPFTLPQTTVPLPGSLVITNAVLPTPAPFVTDVQINDSTPPLAASLNATAPLPDERSNTIYLSASQLDSAGLGGLSVVTDGSIRLDAPVTLANGGHVTLAAPMTEVSAPITARGGSVTIGNKNAAASTTGGYLEVASTATGDSDAASTGDTTSDSTTTASGTVLGGVAVTLTSSAAIDTRGVFTNLALAPGSIAGQAFANGGPVTIDSSQSVTLAPGSVIDSSAGGTVLVNRQTVGATGGAISVIAYDPGDPNGMPPPPTAPLTIAATLRAYGTTPGGTTQGSATQGGAFTLQVPNALISDTALATEPGQVVLPSSFFSSGFSSYAINAATGLTVADGTAIHVTEPVYQFVARSLNAPDGSDPAAAFDLALPPLYIANPDTATITQRAGASLTLSSATNAGTSAVAGGSVVIGHNTAISVDPGQSVRLEAFGQITIDGSITAPGGTISVVNDRYQGSQNAQASTYDPAISPFLSIWLGSASTLDVAAQAVTATDRYGRPFTLASGVPAGGTILLGSPGGTDANGLTLSTDAFIVARPGSVLDASGTSATVDLYAGSTPILNGPHASVARDPTLVTSAGGSIAIDTESGFYLDGTMRAASGGPGAAGGSLAVTLATPAFVRPGVVPLYTIPDAERVPREITLAQAQDAPVLPAGLQPGDPTVPLTIGQGRLSADQIAAGGFDTVALTAGDTILFDGAVTLRTGQSISLTAGTLAATTPDTTVAIAAPYVALNGLASTQGGALYQQPLDLAAWMPSTMPSNASLSVAAGQIDIAGNLFGGIDTAVQLNNPQGKDAGKIDRLGFAQISLASSGDMRFLPGPGATAGSSTPTTSLTTPGDLTLTAQQIYPVAGASAVVTAGFDSYAAAGKNPYLPDGVLTIARAAGATPALPMTAGGTLSLAAGVINQGGVLRSPDGEITLGVIGDQTGSPKFGDAAFTYAVNLLPGSITSVSSAGLAIPFGGTTDGVTYTVEGVSVPTAAFPATPLISINAQSVALAGGATLDLSGGGTLMGAGFISGRGGSTDVLTTPLLTLNASGTLTVPSAQINPVYAILPGAEINAAAPPITASASYAGSTPAVGAQITIPAGVPGLPAGTYTLLPGSDALLPGAFRVEIATTNHAVIPNAVPLGNGSYRVNGYDSVANTSFRSALPVAVTVSSGAVVRNDAQYDEETYSQFAEAQAALFSTPRAPIPEDAKTLSIGFPSVPSKQGPALSIQGTTLFQPAPNGYGGTAIIAAGTDLAITPAGAAAIPDTVSVAAPDLDALGAATLSIGGYPVAASNTASVNFQLGARLSAGPSNATRTPGVTLTDGAVLSAPQVFLVAGPDGVTVERGASINTLGKGPPPIDSSSGLIYNNNGHTVLALSNGFILFEPAAAANGPLTIGTCPTADCTGDATLYTDGTITFVTTGDVTLDSHTRYGARFINFAVPSVNIGTPAAGTTVPAGLTLNPTILATLLAGDPSVGAPALEQLTLTANQSVNFYGSVDLNTLDSTTGQSTLAQLQLNTPAIYGAGGPGDVVNLTTGTFIWNGLAGSGADGNTPPGSVTAGGAGTGSGRLNIIADQIVFGYGPYDQPNDQITLNRLMQGFSAVTFTGNQQITGNAKGTLAVHQTQGSGGDLTLITPLLTGAPASIDSITAGGALTIQAPPGVMPATGPASALGAEIDLQAATISNATAIVLPTGRLVMQATGDITLAAGSRIDLNGQPIGFFDQTRNSWGGDVVLQSAAGNITQQAGASIDISAPGSDAGSLSVTATGTGAGLVALGGTIQGSAPDGFTAGSFDVRAQSLDFAATNAVLDTGEVFGARSFDIKTGDVTIGGVLRAHSVTVSADGGSLTVNGTVDASGASPGTIRLSGQTGLTIAGGAVLDAHGTTLQVDSSGQPIAAENRGDIELSVPYDAAAPGAMLTLMPGARIDLSTPAGPDGIAHSYGTLVLNAPRTPGNDDIAVSATGGVTVAGAASIALYGFKTYASPTDPAGTIAQCAATTAQCAGTPAGSVNLGQYDLDSSAFITAALANTDLAARLAGLSFYGSAFHLRPGIEIDGTGNLTVQGDLDLSGYRYGPAATGNGSGEPGSLVLRAADNLIITGSITDGFAPPPDITGAASPVWAIAPLLPLQPDGSQPQSWSLRLVAGADLAAADSRTLLSPALLVASTADPQPGTITLNNTTQTVLPNTSSTPWSVIRTGTGDLEMLAGGSIQQLSQYSIYTAGAATLSDPAFNLPRGTEPTYGTVTLTGRSLTSIPAGTLLTDGTQVFATRTRATLRPGIGGATTTVTVAPVGGGTILDDAPGTVLTLVKPISGVTSAKVLTQSSSAVLGPVGGTTALENLVNGGPSSVYSANYPTNGGNVLIAAQGNVTGDLLSPISSTLPATDAVGNWLWRQGGIAGQPTAWWINFGTFALPLGQNETQLSTTPFLTGFVGIGALGGGNVTILAGGNLGATTPGATVDNNASSQALDVAVASTGQVTNGVLNQTGGGDITIRVGGAFNGGGTKTTSNDLDGTLTDLRGTISVRAGSIGQVTLAYGQINGYDPRAVSPLVANEATSQGGPTIVLGDGTAALAARGDVVLGGAGDATRLPEQNLTPLSTGQAAGQTWFSLWQPDTAINLFSAGGSLTPSTQAVVLKTSSNVVANDIGNGMATDNGFLYPPTLTAVAASGSIYYGVPGGSTIIPSSIELAPSPVGQLELLAAGSIYANQYSNGQTNTTAPYPQTIDISGADPANLPTPLQPAFASLLSGSGVTNVTNVNPAVYSTTSELPALFAFEADTATGSLHANDPLPALIYAGGDIVDLRFGEILTFTTGASLPWYIAAKAAQIMAGGDIVEPGLPPGTSMPSTAGTYRSSGNLILNNNPDDVSVLSAGHDIIYANFQVAGPGQFYVQAGRNLYQAGQGTLESIGPINPNAATRNGGAGITVLTGTGSSGPDWTGFADQYLDPTNQTALTTPYLAELVSFLQQNFAYTGDAAGALSFFQALPIGQQRNFLLQIYFDELRDSGREFTNPASIRFKSYARGRQAIAALFPDSGSYQGDITLFGPSGIRTDFGGDIDLLAPGGQVILGVANDPHVSASSGVLTQGEGDIGIYSRGSVLLGQSRVFTTFGGSIVIWSATGDINAGRGTNTTDVFTPARLLYDAFGNITLSPSVPTTGAGIATLAPIPGITAGDVDLIAPLGTIDAGEAGIRVSGNANLAALTVVNAANVQVQGKTSGLPTIAVPNVTAISAATSAAAAASQAAQQGAQSASNTGTSQQIPSTITVEVTGFGG